MSSKQKTITEMINELQSENEKCKSLEKSVNHFCRSLFGDDYETVKRMVDRQRQYEAKKAEKYDTTTTSLSSSTN